MRRFRQAPTVLLFAGMVLAVGLPGPVHADEERAANPGADAARLADEVLRKAGGDDLGEWTRSIMERALERAGEAARQIAPGSSGPSAVPLPAERHAGSIAGMRAHAPARGKS